MHATKHAISNCRLSETSIRERGALRNCDISGVMLIAPNRDGGEQTRAARRHARMNVHILDGMPLKSFVFGEYGSGAAELCSMLLPSQCFCISEHPCIRLQFYRHVSIYVYTNIHITCYIRRTIHRAIETAGGLCNAGRLYAPHTHTDDDDDV